jgi:hypothetical protein
MIFDEKTSENKLCIPTFLQQRLNAMPLLIERPPFNFLQLPLDLQICTASFATPHSMSKLSITCKSLHQNLTFQTPGIWSIVTHSITAISEQKLPELYLKAHFCAEDATEEKQKEFYTHIKEKISSCYDLMAKNPYQYGIGNKTRFSFHPFSSYHADHLKAACYTGDENIMHKIHNKKNKLSPEDIIDDLFYIAIDREKINIIRLLCQWHATSLEKLFQQCASHTPYDHPAHTLNWANFLAHTAICNNRKNAFEALIMYYKNYLNLVDKNGMKYLDFIVHDLDKKDYQEYGKIVMKHGAMGKEETMRIMNKLK